MAFSGYNFAEELYNGNIAQTFWKTGSDNIVRGYHYTYDKLNRLRQADFYTETNSNTDAYKEYMTYDVNGNITKLFRNTSDGYGSSQAVDMDDLTYEYQPDSNILINVTDTSGSDDFNGFIDGNTGPDDDYEYDDNGNMVLDRNKDIQSITYNHLNLPVRISFDVGKSIQYTYNAAGQKVNKTVENNGSYEIIDYLDGFQYAGHILQYFPTPEGYVNVTAKVHDYVPLAYFFNYVYNYTDHLGNIRVSYTKDPDTGKLKIIDENHYYPFGLKHERYLPLEKWKFMLDKNDKEKTILKVALTDEYKYKYNGKEWQDELNLNLYDYGARNYDPAIGRWMNVDPLAEVSRRWSPYTYVYNNPLRFIDPDGMWVDDILINKDTGNVKVVDTDTDDRIFISKTNDNGEEVKIVDINGDGRSEAGVDYIETGLADGTISDTVKEVKLSETITDKTGIKSDKLSMFNINDSQLAGSIMEFIGDNVNVEFSSHSFSNDINQFSTITTLGLPTTSPGPNFLFYSGYSQISHDHTHPNRTIEPSGFEFKADRLGNIKFTPGLPVGDRVQAGKANYPLRVYSRILKKWIQYDTNSAKVLD